MLVAQGTTKPPAPEIDDTEGFDTNLEVVVVACVVDVTVTDKD